MENVVAAVGNEVHYVIITAMDNVIKPGVEFLFRSVNASSNRDLVIILTSQTNGIF